MSKLRRHRKARSRVDRIDGRSERCETSLRKNGFCQHTSLDTSLFQEMIKIVDLIVRSDSPSMVEIESIACVRTRRAISHAMTQLYALIEPAWFEKLRSYTRFKGFIQPRGWKAWARRRRHVYRAGKTYRDLSALIDPDSSNGPYDQYPIGNSRRRSRRLRRKLRQMKAASLNDKYGRPRS